MQNPKSPFISTVILMIICPSDGADERRLSFGPRLAATPTAASRLIDNVIYLLHNDKYRMLLLK